MTENSTPDLTLVIKVSYFKVKQSYRTSFVVSPNLSGWTTYLPFSSQMPDQKYFFFRAISWNFNKQIVLAFVYFVMDS